MRKLFGGLIFCALTFVATAQKENAVLSLLAQADRVALQRLDSALIYIDSALNIAQSINNQSLVFKCYRNKAFILEDNTRIKEAIEAYREAKNIAEQNLDNKSKLAIYNDWAIIHKKIKEL
jgi:tetratricopeptide (TPR) repeat protein